MELTPLEPLTIVASDQEVDALRSARGGRTTKMGTMDHALFTAMSFKGWVKEAMILGDGVAWRLTRDGLILADS